MKGQTAGMKTKIDERREREEYDKTHPWLPLGAAVINDGVVCEILFSDMETSRDVGFFLGEDDRWYRMDPPRQMGSWMGRTPMNWRPTNRN